MVLPAFDRLSHQIHQIQHGIYQKRSGLECVIASEREQFFGQDTHGRLSNV
jgi:hypothetical protein